MAKSMLMSMLWPRYRRQLMKMAFRRPKGRIIFEDLISLLYLVTLVRMLLIWLDMAQTDGWYRRWDFVYRALNRNFAYDQNMVVALASILFFALYANYYLYYYLGSVPPSLSHYNEQLNLINTRHTIECNRSMFDWIENGEQQAFKLKYLKSIFHLLCRLRSNDLALRYRDRLPDYPTLTHTNRAKICLVYYGCEVISTVGFVLVSLLCLSGAVLLAPIMLEEMRSWTEFAQYVLDITYIAVMLASFLNTAIGMMCVITVYVFALNVDFRQVNAHLGRMHQQARLAPQRTLWWAWQIELRYFLRHHHRLVSIILVASGKWSPMLLTFVCTNTFANAYIISFLIYRRITPTELIMFYSIIFAQVFIGCLSMVPAAYNSDLAHRAQKHFVRLQPTISDLRLKLQWQRYYEKIKTKRKNIIAYRIGILGKLTIFTMFGFLFTYGESFIFCQNMFLKLQ